MPRSSILRIAILLPLLAASGLAQLKQKQQKKAAAAAAALEGLQRKTIQVAGVERSYYVVQPSEKSLAIQIILVFHGGGGSGETIARVAHIHMLPGAKRSLVVYPDALDKTWNDGKTKDSVVKGKQDVDFVRAMIDDLLKSDKNLDRTRVFAAGLGNGGFFVHRLGCELSDKIAAIVPVGATFPAGLQNSCKPVDPMPVLMVLGDADPLAPIAGSPAAGAGLNIGPSLSADATFDLWRKANACTGNVTVEERPGPPAASTLKIAKPCREAAEVRYIRAHAVAHKWPEEGAREIMDFILRFRRTPHF